VSFSKPKIRSQLTLIGILRNISNILRKSLQLCFLRNASSLVLEKLCTPILNLVTLLDIISSKKVGVISTGFASIVNSIILLKSITFCRELKILIRFSLLKVLGVPPPM